MKTYTHPTLSGACQEGAAFASRYKSLATAWAKCQEPVWLIWYAKKTMTVDKPVWVSLAVQFAERVLPLYEAEHPQDNRPRAAINAAKKWLSEPTEENQTAASAASASAASAAASAAAYAAYAADAADAAAATAAYADAAYAAYADAAAARSKMLAQCADVVRTHYPKAPRL